jgi:hypothetical protein
LIREVTNRLGICFNYFWFNPDFKFAVISVCISVSNVKYIEMFRYKVFGRLEKFA